MRIRVKVTRELKYIATEGGPVWGCWIVTKGNDRVWTQLFNTRADARCFAKHARANSDFAAAVRAYVDDI